MIEQIVEFLEQSKIKTIYFLKDITAQFALEQDKKNKTYI